MFGSARGGPDVSKGNTMRQTTMMKLSIAALVVLSTTASASAFSVRFSWRGIPPCGSTSPAFAVSGSPRGTASLAFEMRDQDAPDFRHGGSAVPYAGAAAVPRGAIAYIGPCPPAGESHTYVWTVDALDASGAGLASTTASGRFP